MTDAELEGTRNYVYSLPVHRRGDEGDRISGQYIPARSITSEDQVTKIAQLATLTSHLHPSTPLSLNIFPNRRKPYGFYIDIDVKYHALEPIIALSNERDRLDETLRGIATNFITEYIGNLVQVHKLAGGEINDSPSFHALYAYRPLLEQLGNSTVYKYGCHINIGEIQAFREDQIEAFSSVRSFLASREGDSSLIVKKSMGTFGVSREDVAKMFDDGPVRSGSILLPGCRKAQGAVTYFPGHILDFRIVLQRSGPVVVSVGETPIATSVDFQPFYPIHPNVPTFVVSSPSHEKVPLPPDEAEEEEEEESLESEAEKRNPTIAYLLSLLSLLPSEKITNPNSGHGYRLLVTNAIVHEIFPRDEREVWAKRIIRHLYDRCPHSTGSEWHLDSHIDEAIQEALTVGKKSGIEFLRKEARSVNPKRVEELDLCFQRTNLKRLTLRYYKDFLLKSSSRGSVISHDQAVEMFKCVAGRDYLVLVNNGVHSWYRYGEYPPPHVGCHKWEMLGLTVDPVRRDIRTRLIPAVESILREDGKASSGAAKVTFASFLVDCIHKLGDMAFTTGMIGALASSLSGHSIPIEFDQQHDYVGCLNGILHFKSHPFTVEHLCTDNRDKYVTRSLSAQYRTDFTDDSPEVKRVLQIFSTIIRAGEELDYFLTLIAGVILTGRVTDRFYVLFGTGGDGKTTLLNACTSLAGNSKSGQGYGLDGDPRIFQKEKRDPNGHDSASHYMYGGPRIGCFAEPDSDYPYLSESAIKSKLSGSRQAVRDLHQPVQHLPFLLVPFVLTNHPLTFKGLTNGGERRFGCIVFTEKFKPVTEFKGYQGNKAQIIHMADPNVVNAFTNDETGLSLREALLWILITRYLPRFYDDCNGDIGALKVPERHAKITSLFLGSCSNMITLFQEAKMVRAEPSSQSVYDSVEEAISITEFINAYTHWHRTTQRGTTRELVRRRKIEDDQQGPVTLDPWTDQVMHMLSASTLGVSIGENVGGKLAPVGPNELVIKNSTHLYIVGWKWKEARAPSTPQSDTQSSTPRSEPVAGSPQVKPL